MVQIGNEITCGILWDEGRVCDPFDTPRHWNQFAELVNCGVRGVKGVSDPADSIRIMIHIDRGCDNAGNRMYFDNLPEWDVDFFTFVLGYDACNSVLFTLT